MTTKKTRSFTNWDTRVKEARREPVVLTIDDTEVSIHQPTGATIEAIGKLGAEARDEDLIRTLIDDDEQADTLVTAAANAPYQVLPELISDLFEEFGITSGANPLVSPN